MKDVVFELLSIACMCLALSWLLTVRPFVVAEDAPPVDIALSQLQQYPLQAAVEHDMIAQTAAHTRLD